MKHRFVALGRLLRPLPQRAPQPECKIAIGSYLSPRLRASALGQLCLQLRDGYSQEKRSAASWTELTRSYQQRLELPRTCRSGKRLKLVSSARAAYANTRRRRAHQCPKGATRAAEMVRPQAAISARQHDRSGRFSRPRAAPALYKELLPGGDARSPSPPRCRRTELRTLELSLPARPLSCAAYDASFIGHTSTTP